MSREEEQAEIEFLSVVNRLIDIKDVADRREDKAHRTGSLQRRAENQRR